MKIQTRIFLGILVIVGIGFFFFVSWLVDDLQPQYRKATEEPLVDAAKVLASTAAVTAKDGEIDVEMLRAVFNDVYRSKFRAKIYDYVKEEMDYRVYITDRSGKVIFDSRNIDEGSDYSQWRDVNLTLKGKYGARTSFDVPGDPNTHKMYVAAPVMIAGEIVGSLSVGKPTRTSNKFMERSKRKIIIRGTLVCISVMLVGVIMSGMVTRPIHKLTGYARAIRDGKRVSLPYLGKSEIRELGDAFEEMRDALEGKQYVEDYVQTLTHEIKSPLSAIQGGVELLKEDMPRGTREQFLGNIQSETGRIQMIIERLLLLASLENRKSIQEVEPLDMREIVDEVKQSILPVLEGKRMRFEVASRDTCSFRGERFLVRHALVNIFQNAIEFTPKGGKISVSIGRNKDGAIQTTIRDTGSGMPDYALGRVYERFYSLKRPDTGKKSSGLGLSLVKEVAHLHGGSFSLENAPGGGAIATLIFPENLK